MKLVRPRALLATGDGPKMAPGWVVTTSWPAAARAMASWNAAIFVMVYGIRARLLRSPARPRGRGLRRCRRTCRCSRPPPGAGRAPRPRRGRAWCPRRSPPRSRPGSGWLRRGGRRSGWRRRRPVAARRTSSASVTSPVTTSTPRATSGLGVGAGAGQGAHRSPRSMRSLQTLAPASPVAPVTKTVSLMPAPARRRRSRRCRPDRGCRRSPAGWCRTRRGCG